MIKKFGRENIIPDIMSDEEANNVYYTIYTPEDEDKY
jgi:ASC-1-like (ASCH) protein